MRTTIRLDDGLLAEAKKLAAASGRTLTAVIEDALREALARRRPTQRVAPAKLPVSQRSGSLQPGIDLDDSAALLEAMESHDASH
jgi:hypothetical protein